MLVGLPILLVLQAASQTPAGTPPAPPCQVTAIDDYYFSKYLDPTSRTLLTDLRSRACASVEAKRTNVNTVNNGLDAYVRRLAVCRGSAVNPQYATDIANQPIGGALAVVHRKFCLDTSDPAGGLNVDVVPERVVWLNAEVFCAASDWASDPSGWLGLLKTDAPSQVRLRTQAESLCAQAREKKLTASEAWYRFDLEMVRWRERLPAETARQATSSIGSLAGFVLDLFK